jgi:ubiquinone/menaquinone biosynthesis C-methylase UbiE
MFRQFIHKWSTAQHSKYWKDRKIDWVKSYADTWTHPKREFLAQILGSIKWLSLVEIGCASGPNLIKIANTFPNRDVGGIDINPEAIEAAQKIFANGRKNAWLKVGSGESVMMSDGGTDVVLTDMMLIYVGPFKIRKYLKEFKRITRNYLVIHELYSSKWYERVWLLLTSGYWAYDYPKLLEKMGFYDIRKYKVPIECFPGADPIQRKYNYVVIASK